MILNPWLRSEYGAESHGVESESHDGLKTWLSEQRALHHVNRKGVLATVYPALQAAGAADALDQTQTCQIQPDATTIHHQLPRKSVM